MKMLPTATLLAAFFFLAAATLARAAQEDCPSTLEQKCTACHHKTRICDKVGSKNRRSWKNTTKRMIRYGLKLEDSEVEMITECLVDLEEKPGKFCD
jgi:hypothetical protein